MIFQIDSMPALSEPLMGCRLETLWHCYHNTSLLTLYGNNTGGLLCAMEGRLLLSGRFDRDELIEFCAFLGVERLEGLACDLPVLPRYIRREQPLLSLASSSGQVDPQIVSDPDLADIFALLCHSTPNFTREGLYLPWLSDLSRRRRMGLARVRLLENAATASSIATGCGYSLLALVCTHPARQGFGLAGRVLLSLANELLCEGLIPFVAAQNDLLTGFYHKLGFTLIGRQAVCYLEK